MRRFIAALIIIPLLAEPAMAGSRPFSLPALSDAELEANSAQGTVTLRIDARTWSDQPALADFNLPMLSGIFGIQNLVVESGAASRSQAATSIVLSATLKGRGF